VTEPEIYAALTDVFHDVFADDTLVLTPALTADDVPGWDSMRMIGILVGVEARLGVTLRSREVHALHCVGDLAAIVAAKLD